LLKLKEADEAKIQEKLGQILEQHRGKLEKVGFVETVDRKGRRLTKRGLSVLDSLSGEVLKSLQKEMPEMAKYG